METPFQDREHLLRNHLQAMGLGIELLNPYGKENRYKLSETDQRALWRALVEHYQAILNVLKGDEDAELRRTIGSRNNKHS